MFISLGFIIWLNRQIVLIARYNRIIMTRSFQRTFPVGKHTLTTINQIIDSQFGWWSLWWTILVFADGNITSIGILIDNWTLL